MSIDQVESDLIRYLTERADRFVNRLIQDSNQRLEQIVQQQQETKEQIMSSMADFDAELGRTGEVLDRVANDVAAQRAEIAQQKTLIEELQAQIGNMGLTAEQEAELLAKVKAIGDKAQVIDDMTPEVTPPPPPTGT